MLISVFATQVFSAKKSPISVPTKVQNKIKETPESPKSWYICELKSKTKAGNVLCGPVESRELILLIWIANSCKPDKNFCIAKNKTYITKNPEKFFSEEFAKVKADLSEFGVADTYEKYFFTNYLTSKTIKLELTDEDGIAQADSDEAEPEASEPEIKEPEVAEAEPEAEEPEVNEPEVKEVAKTEPKTQPKPEPAPEPKSEPDPEPEVPEITEPQVTEAVQAEPEVPEIKEPEVKEVAKAEPEAPAPQIAAETKAPEPEPVKPVVTTPKIVETKPAEPKTYESSQTTKSTRFSEPYVSSDGSLVYKEEYEETYDTLSADQGIIISELKSELKNQIKDELINELRSELKTTTPAENTTPAYTAPVQQAYTQPAETQTLPLPVTEPEPQKDILPFETQSDYLLPETQPELLQSLAQTTEAPETPELSENTQAPEEQDNKFELPLTTEPSKAVARYQRENLLDYAPKKTPALPVDEPVPEYEIIKEPDRADSKGCTLLMKASREGNDRDIRNLLTSGAKVNLKDKEGWNALMYAVRYQENISVIEQLITAGVNIKEKNKYGVSALTLCATYNSNPQILNRLLSFYNPTDKEVMQAFILMLSDNSSSEYSKSVKTDVFLAKGIMLNSFYNSKTPLMYACQYCTSTAIIKKLLDNGASAAVRAADGKTAFDYAKDNSYLPHDDTYWMLNRK